MTTAGPIDYGKSRWRAALSFSPYPLLVLAPFAWLIDSSIVFGAWASPARKMPSLPKRLAVALEGPVDFVMEQRMLRTIRRLAEAAESQTGG